MDQHSVNPNILQEAIWDIQHEFEEEMTQVFQLQLPIEGMYFRLDPATVVPKATNTRIDVGGMKIAGHKFRESFKVKNPEIDLALTLESLQQAVQAARGAQVSASIRQQVLQQLHTMYTANKQIVVQEYDRWFLTNMPMYFCDKNNPAWDRVIAFNAQAQHLQLEQHLQQLQVQEQEQQPFQQRQ